MFKRPLADKRPIGPFAQIGSPDPDPTGSLVIARIDVTGHTDDSAGTVDSEFEENMMNVVADGVAEATSPPGSMSPTTPINFDEAVMFQPFPVSVGQDFQVAVLTMMYDSNLVGSEQDIEDMVDLRTNRVERIDVIQV